MTNPNICGQCDKINSSCCTLRAENNEGLPAPVSEPEITRILNTLKTKSREDIIENRSNSIEFINQMSLLFPDMIDSVHKIFPLNGIHFELKTVEDVCIFKDINGCILPDEARPLFCRIYPFWFFENEPQIFQDVNCLALKNCETIREVFFSLGTRPENLQQIHAQICTDWELFRSIPQEKVKISL